MLDLAAGLIESYTVTDDHFSEAEILLGRFGFSHRLRSLDALQIAVAADLFALQLIDCIVAADNVLLEIGGLVGLPALNIVDPA